MVKLVGHIDEHYKETWATRGIEYKLVWLWNKLVDYGNYWHIFSPTVNGNPDFNSIKGWIDGFCASNGWDWIEKEDEIKVFKNTKLLISMKIHPKPKSYYDNLNDMHETLTKLYGC